MVENKLYRPGVGRLALDRYDFEKHIDGSDFNHEAIGIDLAEPLTSLNNADNVQTAFDALNTYIANQSNAGQGFITIGDGYDTWHNADGSTNFDNTIPALNVVLQPIFDAIINSTELDEAYQRLKNGGIVVIKSGTYIVTDTINVPPGITIMGEGWGTKIVNATALDLTTVPPSVDSGATPKPIFQVVLDPNRTINDGAVDANMFMFSRQTKICNLVIADNFVENTILGDTYYKQPQNKTGNTPLIRQESGSHLLLNNLMMLGRATFSGGTVVSAATRFAVGLDLTTPISTGTILKIDNCFIDGFSQPVAFPAIGGVKDYLEITNSKIRSQGYLDGYATGSAYNTIVSMNDNNAKIVGNDLYGNHANCNTIAYVGAQLVSAPTSGGRSKVIIAANNWVINRGSNNPTTLTPLDVNNALITGDSGTEYYARATTLVYGNTNTNFTVASNSETPQLDVGRTSLTPNAGVYYPVRSITANYTVDSSGSDYVIYADTTSSAITITMPDATVSGRTLIIKDIGGNVSTNNISLSTGGQHSIEGSLANYIIYGDYQHIQLTSRSGAWWITG